MLFDDSYFSIEAPSEGIFKDRGSKFIAFAFPVKSEQEIKEILNRLKKEHQGANHHCYAWRLGADKQNYRANDDGEPNNSAGKPILGQLLSKDLTNVLVVVVRYFGGTLLGVSGLINAYKNAAADALNKSRIIECFILETGRVDFDYPQMQEVLQLLKIQGAKINEQGFDERNYIVYTIRRMKSEQLKIKLTLILDTSVKDLF
jgi:uncharacterized YigZ family protein